VNTGCRARLFSFLLALVAASAAVSPAVGQDEVELTGPYVVVAVRSSSLVAAPLDPVARAGQQALVGASIDFDNMTAWFDGAPCPGSEPSRADPPLLFATDPYLSDLQIVLPGRRDHRLNLSLHLDCGGRALSSVKLILIVDERVLVAADAGTGAPYFVLERPPSADEALRLEQWLANEGQDPGGVDGIIDGSTRAALAALAQAHGAAYRFESGVITSNVLAAALLASKP
jgi:hypothetical protein